MNDVFKRPIEGEARTEAFDAQVQVSSPGSRMGGGATGISTSTYACIYGGVCGDVARDLRFLEAVFPVVIDDLGVMRSREGINQSLAARGFGSRTLSDW